MRYRTETGQYVTAATRAAAAALAAQYGFGALAAPAPTPAKPRALMSLSAARALYAIAHDWPSYGSGWPETARERAAQAVLESHNFDPEE